jgi:hypothetical protein
VFLPPISNLQTLHFHILPSAALPPHPMLWFPTAAVIQEYFTNQVGEVCRTYQVTSLPDGYFLMGTPTMLLTQPSARKISGMDHNASLAPSALRAQETIKLIDENLGNGISHLPKRADHGFRLSAEYDKKREKEKKNKEDIAALNSCHNENSCPILKNLVTSTFCPLSAQSLHPALYIHPHHKDRTSTTHTSNRKNMTNPQQNLADLMK